MIILGIDPGATGAIVLLEDGYPIEWSEMPTVKIGTATRINASALADLIVSYQADSACLELVHAMPGQGVTSMFNFGHSCGTISGILGAIKLPTTLVTPMAWKKKAGLIGTDKDAARAKAIGLWPHWRDLDKKGKGQALADAALIALFAS